jgi:RimJ/RimL family protein N-acetyltransferase
LDDAQVLFEWRNDLDTRQASISTQSLEWSEHIQWLVAALADASRHIYIVEDDAVRAHRSIGVCRFDVEGGLSAAAAEVSINLNPAVRGHGLAGPVLDAAIERFRSDTAGATELRATIRPTNVASTKVFLAAGFRIDRSDGEFDYYTLPLIAKA